MNQDPRVQVAPQDGDRESLEPYRKLHDSSGAQSTLVDDVETTSKLNLFGAWSIGFLTAIEGTVSTPSLWLYVKSLGGDKSYYTFCIAAFALGRFSCMGLFGMWTNRRPFKEVFRISLLFSMTSGILYALAPTFGLWCIPVARGILGAMSCQTVATQSFVSQHTSKAERTKYMSINNAVCSSLSICGPCFNGLLVMLPCFEVVIGQNNFVFNSFTWVGWFLLFCQMLCMIFIEICFTEPSDRNWQSAGRALEGNLQKCVTLYGFVPWGRLFVDRWLHITHAWVCFSINFRNQFTNFAVTWIVPIITDRDYAFNQFENSMVFVGLAAESLVASALIGYSSKYLNDRDSLNIFQGISFCGLFGYCLASHFGTRAIPVSWFAVFLIWYDFGAPASQTQSLYSKLIGPGGNAIYFSVLQSNGAVARFIASRVTNQALSNWGISYLFYVVFALWGVQQLAFFVWHKDLHPDRIADLHKELGPNPSAKGKGKGKAKAKAKSRSDPPL